MLLEAGSRLGGVLETARHDGYLIEHSADNFISNVPWAVDLCRRVGLGDQLIETSRARAQCHDRAPRQTGARAGRFSAAGSRAAGSLVKHAPVESLGQVPACWLNGSCPRKRTDDDESLADFARRRLGREVFERIVQPLVGGIYTADPEKLSLQATLPRFLQMEREHGSLIRAARALAKQPDADNRDSGARYSLFLTLRDGISSLVQAVAARLPAGTIRLNAAVAAIEP